MASSLKVRVESFEQARGVNNRGVQKPIKQRLPIAGSSLLDTIIAAQLIGNVHAAHMIVVVINKGRNR